MGLRSRPRWVKEEEDRERMAGHNAAVRALTRPPLRLVVCGGLDFADQARAFSILDRAHAKRTIARLVDTGAGGAARLARMWAREHGVPITTIGVVADLSVNEAVERQAMTMLATHPNGVIVFPGDPGSSTIARRAGEAGIPVWRPAALPVAQGGQGR